MTREEALAHAETQLLKADRVGAWQYAFYVDALRALGIDTPPANGDLVVRVFSCSKVRDAISGA